MTIRNDKIWEKPDVRPSGVSVLCLDPGETTGYVGAVLPNRWLIERGVDETLRMIAGDPTGVEFGLSRKLQFNKILEDGREEYAGRRHCLWLRYGQINAPSLAPGASYLRGEKMAAAEIYRIARTVGIDGKKLSGGNIPRLCFIVMEDFVLREHTADRNLLAPVRMCTGVFNWFDSSNLFDLEFVLQQVSDAKSLVKDDYLKSVGLYFPGMPHATDAARHLVLFTRYYCNRAVAHAHSRDERVR